MLPLYDAQLESYTGASERYRRMANTKAGEWRTRRRFVSGLSSRVQI
jgi:hypothetical protein